MTNRVNGSSPDVIALLDMGASATRLVATYLVTQVRAVATRAGREARALGAVRLRQQLNLQPLTHDVQLALLRRSIATMVDEITADAPLRRVTHMVALAGDVRFAASQIPSERDDSGVREVPRDTFLAFCDQIEPYDHPRPTIGDPLDLSAGRPGTLICARSSSPHARSRHGCGSERTSPRSCSRRSTAR